MDVAHCITPNSSFDAKIKMLKSCYIFYDISFFKAVNVKGDGSCLYRTIASHVIFFCLQDVWTERFLHGKKPGIEQATFNRANDDVKEFIAEREKEAQKRFLLLFRPRSK